LHPQPFTCESPQHAAFAAGSQQEVCLAGPQQELGAVDADTGSVLACPDAFSAVASCGWVVIVNLPRVGKAG
jgi:hypothetical protein